MRRRNFLAQLLLHPPRERGQGDNDTQPLPVRPSLLIPQPSDKTQKTNLLKRSTLSILEWGGESKSR